MSAQTTHWGNFAGATRGTADTWVNRPYANKKWDHGKTRFARLRSVCSSTSQGVELVVRDAAFVPAERGGRSCCCSISDYLVARR